MDSKDIRDLVRFHLEKEGYAVAEAETGEEALHRVARERPALVVLDIMLPGTDGLEVCRRLRGSDTVTVPIVMLTAKAAEVDRVLGLEMGADDYITKPFSPRELVARVRAVLRRTHGEDVPSPHEIFERGRLRIDFDTYEVFVDGQQVNLSLREFELLKFFVRHPHRVYDRLQLLGRIGQEPRRRLGEGDARSLEQRRQHVTGGLEVDVGRSDLVAGRQPHVDRERLAGGGTQRPDRVVDALSGVPVEPI